MNISVIIPTCNRPLTLVRAIESVMSQIGVVSEIIVVDDSPNDLSAHATASYVERGLVRYFKNAAPRSGPAFSRNFGVGAAKNEWVAFLDDDDVYLPGRLQSMLAVAHSGSYVFVSSGRFYEHDDFKVIRNVVGQHYGEIRLAQVQFANDIDIGFMVKRSIFLELGGFDTSFKNLEDWDFVLRMLMIGNGYKVQRLDYAVNINTDKPRVSTDDHVGYYQLAEKHQRLFGVKWYVFMRAMSGRLAGTLTARTSLQLAKYGGTLSPVKIYTKARLTSMKGLHHMYRRLVDTL